MCVGLFIILLVIILIVKLCYFLLDNVSVMAVYHNYLLGIIFIPIYIKYFWKEELNNPVCPGSTEMFSRYKFVIIGGLLIIFWFILTRYNVLPPKIEALYKFVIYHYHYGEILISFWFLISIILPFVIFAIISGVGITSTIKSFLRSIK